MKNRIQSCMIVILAIILFILIYLLTNSNSKRRKSCIAAEYGQHVIMLSEITLPEKYTNTFGKIIDVSVNQRYTIECNSLTNFVIKLAVTDGLMDYDINISPDMVDRKIYEITKQYYGEKGTVDEIVEKHNSMVRDIKGFMKLIKFSPQQADEMYNKQYKKFFLEGQYAEMKKICQADKSYQEFMEAHKEINKNDILRYLESRARDILNKEAVINASGFTNVEGWVENIMKDTHIYPTYTKHIMTLKDNAKLTTHSSNQIVVHTNHFEPTISK